MQCAVRCSTDISEALALPACVASAQVATALRNVFASSRHALAHAAQWGAADALATTLGEPDPSAQHRLRTGSLGLWGCVS